MDRTESTALEKAKKIIESYDFQPIINRLVQVEKWPKDEAILAVKQYRQYLFLRKKYPDQILPPSKEIDEAWHAHILHTRAYREFCRQVFDQGDVSFLDHNPAEDADSSEKFAKYFEKTQYLHKKEFGNYLYQIRGRTIFRKFLDKWIEKWASEFPEPAIK